MSDKNKQIVYLPNGSYTIDKNGKAISIDKIVVPTPNDCCMLDCCNNVIKFVDDTGTQREISLELLYLSTLEVATSANITGCLTDTPLVTGTRQLTAVVLPSTAPQTGTWTSSLPGRANVSSTGLVTNVEADGAEVEVIITFTSSTGNATATCTITIPAPE